MNAPEELLSSVASRLLCECVATLLRESGFVVEVVDGVDQPGNFHGRAWSSEELEGSNLSTAELIATYWMGKIANAAGDEKQLRIFPHPVGLEQLHSYLANVEIIVSRIGCSVFK